MEQERHQTGMKAVLLLLLAVGTAAAPHVNFLQFSQNGKPSGVRSAIGYPIEVLEFAWRKYGSRLIRARCGPNPPGRDGSEMQQPILGLYTAPPRLELVVWACLGPPWPSLPAEPCDPPSVGHFSLASKGTERGPHRPACGMR